MKIFDWVPDIKAILWDLDGTLYKFTPALRKAFGQKTLRLFERATGKKGRELERLYWSTYKKIGSNTKVLDSVGLDGKEEVAKIGDSIPFERLLSKDEKLLRMIRSLKQLKHVVLTNADRRVTERKLRALGLPKTLFAEVLVTHEAPYIKPDPRLFRWAAKRIGLKPEQILAVGDREQADILPAREVGMRTAYVWGKSREADVSFGSVYEVAELFGQEM